MFHLQTYDTKQNDYMSFVLCCNYQQLSCVALIKVKVITMIYFNVSALKLNKQLCLFLGFNSNNILWGKML